MKQISANITGSFILNGIDLTTTVESSSIWSGSIASRVSNLEQFSSSLDATFATDAQLNAVTQSVNTLSSSFLSYTSSTDDKIAQLNRETASLNLATASLYAATASLYVATASINSYTSSNNNSIADIRVTTASLYAATASINNYTASTNNAISDIRVATASLYAATASIYNATASIYGATSSLFSYTASNNANITSLNAATASLNQYTASLNLNSSSFATTGSNTFVGTQYFSNASNAISFTSTGSFYSDGGVRVTKDLYVSGTSYFNNVTVFGTQSVNYITSSQLNIATNIITVNTSTPTVRFGGLAVYDSGSLGTGLTGSILWDSEDNQWIYSNPSGSTYDSAVFLVGPRSFGALGNEPGITVNSLIKGDGAHHTTSSAVFEVSGSVGIGTSSPAFALDTVGVGRFSGGIRTTGANGYQDTDGTRTVALYANYAGGTPGVGTLSNHDFAFYTNGTNERMRINTSGNVGIGTTNPSFLLDISGSTSNSNGGIIRLFASSSDASLRLGVTSSYSWIQAHNSKPLYINELGNNTILNLTAGNVGIGTTNPSQAKLHVEGSIYYTSIIGSGGLGGRLWVPGQAIGQASNAGLYGLALTYLAKYESGWKSVGGGYASAITVDEGIFSFSNSQGVGAPDTALTWTTRLMIDTDGKVGIGTTAANGVLDISSGLRTGTTSGLFIGADSDTSAGTRTNNTRKIGMIASPHYSNATRPVFGIAMDNQVSNNFIYIGGAYSGYNAATTIAFSTGTTTTTETGTERMRITSDGNIGIGTTAPGATLDVSRAVAGIGLANVLASPALAITNPQNWGYAVGMVFRTPMTNGGAITNIGSIWCEWSSDNNTYLGFATNTSGTVSEKMRITNNGSVGIGTTSPIGKFQIGGTSGNLLTVGTLTNDWGGDVAIGVTTGNGIIISKINTNNDQNRVLVLSRDDSGGGGTVIGYKPSGLSNAIGFRLQSTGSSYFDGGDVGIGNTSPTAYTGYRTLHIGDASRIGLIKFGTGTDANGPEIFTNSNNNLFFLSNNADIRMTISGSGNVGIGTSTPSNRLTVHQGGGVRVTGITNGSYIELSGDLPGYSANAYPVIKSNGTIHFANNGKYSAFIEGADTYFGIMDNAGSTKVNLATNGASYFTGGNVGIGTTSPFSKLHIEGSNAYLAVVDNASYAAGVGGAVYLYGNYRSVGDVTVAGYIKGSKTNSTNGDYGFDLTFGNQTYTGGVSEKMRIASNGNVGIGTTSATAKLHIEGNNIVVNTENSAQAKSIYFRYSNGATIQSDSDLRFNTGGSPTEKMRITADGNVGIGTTSPNAKLDVYGTIRTSVNTSYFSDYTYLGAQWYLGSGEATDNIDFKINGGGTFTTGGNFRWFTQTGNTTPTERFRITAAGTVQPGANGTQNLGSSSLRWSTVFTSDLSLSNGIGDYTIVEGENDLFLYNNKQNKVYKFVVEEVDPSTATPKKS